MVGVIVSLSGEVLAVNEPASSVYDVEPGDTLDALAMCSDSVAQLYALLNNTIDLEQPVFLRLSRAMSGSPIIARVSRTALCVQIDTTDVSWSRELSDDLQSQYDLSVAEVSILEMFIEGFALEDIASARNSSMATVRTQQRALFEKLDVCSMSDLIRFSIGVVAKLSRVPALGEDRAGLTSSDVEQKIAGLFMTAFNYSQAETDIALMLARGYSPTAIAVKRDRNKAMAP